MICKDLWDICENKHSLINKREREREMELEDELIFKLCIKNQNSGLWTWEVIYWKLIFPFSREGTTLPRYVCWMQSFKIWSQNYIPATYSILPFCLVHLITKTVFFIAMSKMLELREISILQAKRADRWRTACSVLRWSSQLLNSHHQSLS